MRQDAGKHPDERIRGSAMKVYFIRHGQSLGNAEFRFLGHTDLDLTELGYAQAEATSDYLSDVRFDAIYSSDLLRAYNTAVPNAKKRNLSVIPREGLREVFCGDWEGMICADIEAKYGSLYTFEWPMRYGLFAFPGGESTVAAGDRFYKEVLSICKENIGKNLLVVAHGAVIRSFWSIISGISPKDIAEKLPFATNASVSIAEFDGELFSPIEYSIDSHLSGVGITSIKF